MTCFFIDDKAVIDFFHEQIDRIEKVVLKEVRLRYRFFYLQLQRSCLRLRPYAFLRLHKTISSCGSCPPLDFSGIVGNRKKDYIQAIHAGIEHNYLPMERIFNAVIRRTLRIRGHRQL